MTQVLLLNYSVYIRTRETLWHDIHHLYLLAVENGVDQVKLKEHKINNAKLNVVSPRDIIKLSHMEVEFIKNNHALFKSIRILKSFLLH